MHLNLRRYNWPKGQGKERSDNMNETIKRLEKKNKKSLQLINSIMRALLERMEDIEKWT